MTFERLKEKDFGHAIALIKEEFPYIGIPEEKIKERLTQLEVFVFAAKEGKEIAGLIDLTLSEETGTLNGLAVKKKFRQKGIGKQLLKFALEFLQENGATTIRLLVKQENAVAKKMYQKAGFKFARIHPKKIHDSIIEEMELENKNALQKIFEKMIT